MLGAPYFAFTIGDRFFFAHYYIKENYTKNKLLENSTMCYEFILEVDVKIAFFDNFIMKSTKRFKIVVTFFQQMLLCSTDITDVSRNFISIIFVADRNSKFNVKTNGKFYTYEPQNKLF